MNSYISLEELKRVLEIEEQDDSGVDHILRSFCIKASRFFDTRCTNKILPKRRFYPAYETRYFPHPVSSSGSVLVPQSRGSAAQLRLCDDLLAIDTLTTNNGGTTVTSPDYFLYKWPGRVQPGPFDTIGLLAGGTITAFESDSNPMNANAVTGWWGYHEDWANAFENSQQTVVDDPLSDSATTLTVTDVDADDINGLPNVFQSLQLLRIEDEYLWASKADPSTDTITVVRGVNGTTAVEHLQGTAVYIYRPMEEIKLGLEYLAMHLYKRKDSVGTPDQRPLAAAKGLLVFPASMPKEVTDIIDSYAKDAL
jgi:hypothetical protein